MSLQTWLTMYSTHRTTDNESWSVRWVTGTWNERAEVLPSAAGPIRCLHLDLAREIGLAAIASSFPKRQWETKQILDLLITASSTQSITKHLSHIQLYCDWLCNSTDERRRTPEHEEDTVVANICRRFLRVWKESRGAAIREGSTANALEGRSFRPTHIITQDRNAAVPHGILTHSYLQNVLYGEDWHVRSAQA